MQMNRQWMYRDPHAQAFRDGLRTFLDAAEAYRTPSGFMFCPCTHCKNIQSYKQRGCLQVYLMRHGFMRNYSVWTKHGERGILMDEDEKDEADDDISLLAQYYGSFAYAAMGDADEEVVAREGDAQENEPTDGLGQMLRDADKDYDNDKE